VGAPEVLPSAALPSAALPSASPDIAEAEERGRAIERAALSRRKLLWGGGAVAAGAAGVVLSTPSTAAADPASSVTVVPTGGISSTDAQAAFAELDTEKANKAFLWLNARDAGCDNTGTTDCTTPLQSALTLLAGAGGGTVFLPPGRYRITGPVTVPHSVDLWGSGGHKNPNGTTAAAASATVIEADSATAQLVFGSPSGSLGSRGGLSGNFAVYGKNASSPATGLVYLDLCVERQFTAITVARSGSHGMVVERTQNCTFTALQISQSLGDGLVLDKGAGGNAFLRCELEGSGVCNTRIKETVSGSYPYNGVPQHNLFLHCINERAHASTSTYTSGMIVSGGIRNKFSHCIFACSTSFSASSEYIVDVTSTSAWLQFDDCSFQGHIAGQGTVTRAIRSVGGVFFTGISWFENLTQAVQWNTGAWGELVGWFRYSNVPTLWDGTGDWKNKGFTSAFPFTATIDPLANLGHRVSVRGENGFRFQVGPVGQLQLNDGVGFTPKAEWKLSTADGNNGWETAHHVRLLSSSLAIQTTTNPLPTSLLPDGRAAVYVKNNRLVVAYKPSGGAIRYKTLKLDDATVAWADSTTAP
jgi:hypothetical protein